MKVRRRKLAELTPYARNPRRIDTGAVAAVAASLTRFGWQQPLVVDPHDVIEPGYVDVAVERWQQLTGKKARRRAA